MRRFLPSSTSWFLRKFPNPRFYCCCCSSSPSISTPDPVNPKTPDSKSKICIPHTDSTKDQELSSKEPIFYDINQDITITIPDPFLADVEDREDVKYLMYQKSEPHFALKVYESIQKKKKKGDLPENAVLFCVLLHILATSSMYHGLVTKMLDSYVSSDSCPVGLSLYDQLLKLQSWKIFASYFKFNPWVYSALLTAYARADRCSDAIDCFNAMLTQDIVPTAVAINAVLRLLIRKDMILEAKNLYGDVVSKGLKYDCATVRIMMNLSLKEGKVEDEEKYFMDSIAHPPVQYTLSYNYRTAIDFACDKLDSEGAYKLLCEMKNLGCTPFEATYTNVICTCVKQGNMVLALKLKEDMMHSGHSLNIVLVTNLMKGYILEGDLSSALDLFDKMSDEYGLFPDKDTYAVMIEGCSNHGNMDKAFELNKAMKLAGIKPSVSIVNSLIRGFFKTQMPDEALKQLNDAIVDGIANAFTYDDVLGCLCKEVMTDEARGIWDKLAKKGVENSVVDSSSEILGHCKEGFHS